MILFNKSIFAGSLSCLVLSVFFWHCSPLTPSVDKSQLEAKKNTQGTAQPWANPQQLNSIDDYSTFILGTNEADRLYLLPAGTLFQLDPIQRDTLLREGQIRIQTNGMIPAQSIFILTLNSSAIAEDDLDEFKTKIEPDPQNPSLIVLSVDKSVKASVVGTVLMNFSDMYLSFSLSLKR